MKYTKLPKRFKTKWLNALRSGKFKQGENHLRQIDDAGNVRHCCLGVAGHICGISDVLLNRNDLLDFPASKRNKQLPEILKGDHFDNELVHKLTLLNDNSKSFKPVIRWIEKYL